MIAGFQALGFPDLATGPRVSRPSHRENQRPESPPRNVHCANNLTHKLSDLRLAWAIRRDAARHNIRANEERTHYVVRWGCE
jgi:hypothetical protein